MRYHEDLLRARAVDVQQSRPGRLRHRDDHAGRGDDLIEDRALPWRGVRQDRVQDHDARYVQRFEQRDDVLAVGAAVDAVLVLHDHDVEAVEHLGCRCRARSRAVHEVMHDLVCIPRHRLVQHAHDGYLIARLRQMSEQRRAEGGQPALCGRIGAEQCVRRRHAMAPCVSCSDANCGASGSSSRADGDCAVTERRASPGPDDGKRPMVSTAPNGGTGALRRGRHDRSVRLDEAGWRRELQFWSGILRRDFHGTPEAGSSGLACPPTSRAVAERPPRPRVVNAW